MEKILLVGPVPPPFGGIASVVEDIAGSDLSLEYDIEVFSGPALYPAWMKARIPRICFRVYWFLLFGYRLLRRRYALVHIHAAGSAFFRNA
ncbi:MAG: glycosyltransferase family 1 protein, partial [Pseudomonadota bacterium]